MHGKGAAASPQVRQEYSVMAAENAMMLLEGSKADVVMIYASTPEETSTWPLMDQLLMRGYYPVFPLVQGEKMVPIMWDENTVFVSNKMGILEPVGGTRYRWRRFNSCHCARACL